MGRTCLLTYNLYFEPIELRMRMNAIGKIIEKYRPAVIALQEVTTDILELLRKKDWFKFYDCSVDTIPPRSTAYFVVLLTALPVLSRDKYVFRNSGMGRELIYAKLDLGDDRNLIVGTTHLESLSAYATERITQLNESLNILSSNVKDFKTVGALLLCDSNILNGEMLRFDSAFEPISSLNVEAAKSSRSMCRKCKASIAKGEIRIGKTVLKQKYEEVHWYHVSCSLEEEFFQGQISLQMIKMIPGFAQLDTVNQIKVSETILNKEISPAILSEKNELSKIGLPEKWEDLWLTIDGNTEENGFTYDGKLNKMIKQSRYRSRFDRIFIMKGNNYSQSKALEIQLVGKDSIDQLQNIWPSDHFGVQTFIEWIEDSKTC